MIIYIDRLSGKEVASDCLQCKTVGNGNWLAIQAKMIVVGGESYDTGANASAEGGEEELADGAEKVMNIVHSHKLFRIGPITGKGSRSAIKGYYQTYWKMLKNKFEEDNDEQALTEFKSNFKKINNFVKKRIFGKEVTDLGDWEFYLPEDSDGLGTGMVIAAKWGNEACPVFYLPKIGLRDQKV